MIPVVITAADIPGGLGLARALRGLGVPIYGLTSNTDSPCCRSSVWSDIESVTPMTPSRGCSMRSANSPLVIPGKSSSPAQDDDVDIISRHRELLSKHYRFVLPDHPTVKLLADKTVFARWAPENGFLVPRTHVVSSPGELDTVLKDLPSPSSSSLPCGVEDGWRAAVERGTIDWTRPRLSRTCLFIPSTSPIGTSFRSGSKETTATYTSAWRTGTDLAGSWRTKRGASFCNGRRHGQHRDMHHHRGSDPCGS